MSLPKNTPTKDTPIKNTLTKDTPTLGKKNLMPDHTVEQPIKRSNGPAPLAVNMKMTLIMVGMVGRAAKASRKKEEEKGQEQSHRGL